MEIIKRGELPNEKLIQLTCNNCKTIFKFKQGEANYSGGGNDWCYTINCPLCSTCCSFGGQTYYVGNYWTNR
jgi:hypothetical protein